MQDDSQSPATNWQQVDQQTIEEHTQWLAGGGGSATSRAARKLSERTSRRSVIARLGKLTLGATGVALVSALPVARTAVAQETGSAAPQPVVPPFDGSDPSTCEYWRWCNMDGRVCADCSGGGVTTCPPGSQAGAEFWVGCCTDPDTQKTYLIAYYDCCGSSGCSASFCGEPDSQAKMYNPVSGSYDQQVIWCVSEESQSYTCTLAPIIGEDCQVRPAARPGVRAGA